MIHRRIIYALALAGALLFQITNDNYLAHFLLALVLALPLLSLALSLPGMAGRRLRLSAAPPSLPRGGTGLWRLEVEGRAGLPIPRLSLRLESSNLLTGARETNTLSLSGVIRRRPVEQSARTGHCGLLEYRVTRVRTWDYLGLFSLSCPLPAPARMLSLPIPADPGPLHIPEGQGLRPSPAAGVRRGRGEDYDLREYRPGDPMRTVHWKLSSKWDELIVREPVDVPVPLPLLTFDRRGPAEALDGVLDRLLGLCRAFLAVQRPCAVLWLSPEGEAVRHVIADEKDLRECLLAILSAPALAGGPSVLDRPELLAGPGGPVYHIHIPPEQEAAHD